MINGNAFEPNNDNNDDDEINHESIPQLSADGQSVDAQESSTFSQQRISTGLNVASPILIAIRKVENEKNILVEVYLTQKWWEPHPLRRAKALYEYSCNRKAKTNLYAHHESSTHVRNSLSLFLYINLKRHKYALIGSMNRKSQALGSKPTRDAQQTPLHLKHTLQQMSGELKNNLYATHYEKAIALAIETLL